MGTPTVGRIVLAVGFRATLNGTDTAPALLTRVWGEGDEYWTVNATVFPDTGSPISITSARLYKDGDAARESIQHPTTTALYWPPRV